MKYLILILLLCSSSHLYGDLDKVCVATRVIDRLQVIIDAYQSHRVFRIHSFQGFVGPLNTIAFSLRAKDRGFFNPNAMKANFDAVKALKEKFGKSFRGKPDWHEYRGAVAESFNAANKLYAAISTAKFNLNKYKEIEDEGLKTEIEALLSWLDASMEFNVAYPGDRIRKILEENPSIIEKAVGIYEKEADTNRKRFLSQYIQDRLIQDGAIYLYRIGGGISIAEVEELAKLFAYVRSPNFAYQFWSIFVGLPKLKQRNSFVAV